MPSIRFFLRTLLVIPLLVTQVVLSPPASAAPGDLDPTFGTGGKVTTDFFGGSSDDDAEAVALQPDGKIVVAGTLFCCGGPRFGLARYNRDGTLDSSFGSGGTVTTDFGTGSAVGYDLALQPDGKIIVVGAAGNFALARYNPDGSLDSSFGTEGKVTTDFAGSSAGALAVALQTDGKIVAAGGTGPFWGVARYNPDGSLDTSFGSGGKVVTTIAGEVFDLGIQADGKIVAAGFGFDRLQQADDFALARYKPDGSLDTTFGTDGEVTTDFGGDDFAVAVALQSDGKIVAAGYSVSLVSPFASAFELARYDADGSLDSSFGFGGKVTTDFASSQRAEAVALQPDGRIVAAGIAGNESTADFALARYNPDGSLDSSFGAGGRVATDFADNGDVAFAVALQPDGKIVTAGVATVGSSEDFALARYEGGAVITVAVDIKPGSSTNPIKVSSMGRIPAAILSTSSFGATTVDPTSVCFGDAETPAQRDCTEAHSSLEDVNGDGRQDLLLHFETRQTGVDPGDTEACLTGETFGRVLIRGCDSVVAR